MQCLLEIMQNNTQQWLNSGVVLYHVIQKHMRSTLVIQI